MNDTVQNAEHVSKPKRSKKKRSRPRRILRFLVFIAAGFFLLLVALIGITETRWFKNWLRDTLVETVNTNLNASLQIGAIDGNIFTGIRLRDVGFITHHGPLLRCSSATVRYDLFQIPLKNLRLHEIQFERLEVMMLRSRAGVWNFDNLSKDTSAGGGSLLKGWTIAVGNFRMSECRFVVFDSTQEPAFARDRIDYSHLDLSNISLALAAIVSDRDKKVSINRFAFDEIHSGFALRNLTADVRLTPEHASARNLSIQTDRSALELTASLDGLDFLQPVVLDTLARKQLTVALDVPKIDLLDVRCFLPALDILGGIAALNLRASGSLAQLDVADLELQTTKSDIRLEGELRRIHHGADMGIRVFSNKTTIDPAELPAILPGIPLPDFSEVGACVFSSLAFDGKPLDFTARIDMKSPSGDASGDIALNLTHADMKYRAALATRGIDLSRILRSPRLSSSLNTTVRIEGTGTAPRTLAANATITADSSRFARYIFNRFSINGDASSGKISLDVAATMGVGRVDASAKFNYSNDSLTALTLTSDVKDFDLSQIIDDDSLASRLSFHLTAATNGIDPQRSSGSIKINMSASDIGRAHLPAGEIAIEVDQRNEADKFILLTTPFADLDLRGAFDVRRTLRYFSAVGNSIAASGHELRLQPPNPSAPTMLQMAAMKLPRTLSLRPPPDDSSSFIDARYSLSAKNLEPLMKQFGAEAFICRGSYSGTMRGNGGMLTLTGHVQVSDLYHVDTSAIYLAAGLDVDYSITHNRSGRFLSSLRADVTARAQDIAIDEMKLHRLFVRMQYADRRCDLTLRGTLDTTTSLAASARVTLDPTAYRIGIERLNVEHLGLPIRNEAPFTITIDTAAVEVAGCRLLRDNILIRLDGRRSFDGVNTFDLVTKKVRVRDVEYLLTRNAGSLEGLSFDGLAGVELRVRGSDEAPELSAYVTIDSLSYRDKLIGNLELDPTYLNRQLTVFGNLNYVAGTSSTEQVLFLSGVLPIDLAFEPREKRLLDQPASLFVRLEKFPLAILEKFVGVFSQLEGVANADIHLHGSMDNPEYEGALTFEDARGIFRPNNMRYQINAKIIPSKQSIVIDNVTVRNDPQDYSEGRMVASGKLDIENLRLTGFSVKTLGSLKVLKASSRSAAKVIYGDLYVATGDEGILYSGRPDRSKLVGRIELTRGNLVLPSDESGGGARKSESIVYVEVNDTTKEKASSLSAGEQRRRKSLLGKALEEESRNGSAAGSFLDGLVYDLTLATQAPIRLSIPFNNLTQEELNAQLTVDQLRVDNWGGRGKFEGSVRLTGDSYYLFFGKKFLASGTLGFTGDPLNPELNLSAIYSGYRLDPTTKDNRKIFVILSITGTKAKPSVAFDIRQDAVDGSRPDLGDVQSDAISFILTGSFTSELTSSEKGQLLDKAQGLSNTLAASLLSSAMSGFLQKTGLNSFINRVELSGLGSSDTRLKLTTEIGRAVVTYDGKITDLGSSDVKIEIPLTLGIGNFILEISRRTSSTSMEGVVTSQESSIYEAKILYRISF